MKWWYSYRPEGVAIGTLLVYTEEESCVSSWWYLFRIVWIEYMYWYFIIWDIIEKKGVRTPSNKAEPIAAIEEGVGELLGGFTCCTKVLL